MNDVKIAKACHEVNRVYNKCMGCASQSWDNLSESTKNEIIKSVNIVINDPDIQPSDIHDIWVNSKLAQGWKYGDELCYESKTHPCLISYDELSVLDKVKDEMFIAIVNILK